MPDWQAQSAIIAFCFGAALSAVAVWLAGRSLHRRDDQRRREAERRAADAQRLAELGTMTGGLAHEIKNPLSTIGLNAQLLAEEISDAPLPHDEKGRLLRRLDALRREAERLRGILTDFLQFAGRVRLARVPTDVNRLVEELVDFFTPQAQNAGVRLHYSLPPHRVEASVDPAALKQAVMNLLLNATEAMSNTVDTNHPRDLLVRLDVEASAKRSRSEPSMLVIRVSDTGPGVPPDAINQIFRPYYTTKAGGTGLGLPTTRRLIEEHGGTIDVHSEAGKGSEFVIRIPMTTHVAAWAPSTES